MPAARPNHAKRNPSEGISVRSGKEKGMIPWHLVPPPDDIRSNLYLNNRGCYSESSLSRRHFTPAGDILTPPGEVLPEKWGRQIRSDGRHPSQFT
eukprot:1196271-Prorocentrum_minimum.AAC.1